MNRAIVYPMGVWVGLAVAAVVNGGFRAWFLIPLTGELLGYAVSTAMLLVVILVVSYWFFTRGPVAYDQRGLVGIGFGWVVLTVGFEFLVGYLAGTPVTETVGQYDLLAGNLWVFVPLTLLFAPVVFGRIRARRVADETPT